MKKLTNKILGATVFLLAALTIVPQSSFAQMDGKKIVQENNQSICKILLWDPVFGQVVEEWGFSEDEAFEFSWLSRGSGFFVTEDGYIFTNRHVAEQCIHGWVLLDYTIDGEKYEYQQLTYFPGLENDPAVDQIHYAGRPIPVIQVFRGNGPDDYDLYIAEVVSLGTSFDGAMLKIVSDQDGNAVGSIFNPVGISNSDEAVMGESICIYGFPAQYQGGVRELLLDRATLTFGVHSGLDYVFNEEWSMIKTDADINGGNSGGPAFGEDYKVVGIATAKGNKTNIGLLGGINGMYHIAQAVPDAFNQLVKKGLTRPSFEGSKTVYTAADKPALPDVGGTTASSGSDSDSNTGTGSGLITIGGVVKSADTGGPIGNATVGLLKYVNGEAVVASSAVTDAEGIFVLQPDIEPGSYVFAALADGYEDVVVDVELTQTDVYEVTMRRAR
jgi:S1-C subfamily serine protease